MGTGDADRTRDIASRPRVPPVIFSPSRPTGRWPRAVFVGVCNPGKVGVGWGVTRPGVLVQPIRLVSGRTDGRRRAESRSSSIYFGWSRGGRSRGRASGDRDLRQSYQVVDTRLRKRAAPEGLLRWHVHEEFGSQSARASPLREDSSYRVRAGAGVVGETSARRRQPRRRATSLTRRHFVSVSTRVRGESVGLLLRGMRRPDRHQRRDPRSNSGARHCLVGALHARVQPGPMGLLYQWAVVGSYGTRGDAEHIHNWRALTHYRRRTSPPRPVVRRGVVRVSRPNPREESLFARRSSHGDAELVLADRVGADHNRSRGEPFDRPRESTQVSRAY